MAYLANGNIILFFIDDISLLISWIVFIISVTFCWITNIIIIFDMFVYEGSFCLFRHFSDTIYRL